MTSEPFAVKPQTIREAALFVLLVGAAVASRLIEYFPPNAHAVAAAALLAGVLFRSRIVAVCVPLASMMISDSIIGGHDGLVMFTVYASLVLPVVWGSLLKRDLLLTPAAALVSSAVFYLTTNFAHWYSFGDRMQEVAWTLGGLAHCYAIALPFFKYTLIGDLSYTTVLFGAYCLVKAGQRENVPGERGSVVVKAI
jgi:hypothetical protein